VSRNQISPQPRGYDNPLKYVNPSGFQEQPVSDRNAIAWDDSQDIHVWVLGEPREPREETTEDEPEEAADVGATITPTDFGVTGNSAGGAPSSPPTSTELPDKPLDPATRVLLGAARGVGVFALETGKYLALTAITFGGYATFRLYAGMWAGYHEQAADGTKMGVVGAINSLNPLYAIAKGALETYGAAERGDFEAAGEKGVVTAIVTAVTVVGVIQGLGSLGGKPPGAGSAASTAATTAESSLAARASQIHGVLDEIAQTQRTTVVLRTSGGDIVAAGGRDLTPAQRALLTAHETPAKMPGTHAGVTALTHAERAGLTPEGMGVSRPICPDCVRTIQESGGVLTSPTTAIWPK
jgi:hypothetical protein